MRINTENKTEIIISAVMVSTGFAIIGFSQQLSRQVYLMPATIGWVMTVCGLLNLVFSKKESSSKTIQINISELVLLVLIALMLFLRKFIPLIYAIGFASFLLYFYMIKISKQKKNNLLMVFESLLFSVSLVAIIHVVFVIILRMRMPNYFF